MLFPQPKELNITERRESVDGPCGRCGTSFLQRYRTVDYRGWLRVVKCGACLAVASSERILPPVYSGDVA